MNAVALQSQISAAVAHHLAGRFEQAERAYAQILLRAPREYQVLHLKGALAYQQQRPAEAAKLLGRALQVQPKAAPTLMCLGLAQAALGQAVEAEANLRAAVRLDPKNPEGWSNLSAFLLNANRLEEAIACRRSSLQHGKPSADALTALGAALVLAGQVNEGISYHRQAIDLAPRHTSAHHNLACAYQHAQRTEEALLAFETHLALQPNHLAAQSGRLFLRNYDAAVSREESYSAHLVFGKAAAAAQAANAAGRRPAVWAMGDGERRLRVAFLSPDLRTHAVAMFLEPLLRHLDRSEFEVLLYHDHYVHDATSERLKAGAAVWRNFCGKRDPEVEAAIRTDAPDILFDLAGHTGANRLPLFARRLAPIQISYLGYPNTTGLAEMDYRLTDAVADPEGVTDRFHTETLVRFAPTAWAFQPPVEAAAPAPPPSRSRGYVTFGSFNAFAKVNAATLQLWRAVLEAVPGSRLVLKSAGLDPAEARARLDAAGLGAERCDVLSPCREYSAHLASYAAVDIALDPFPYNGTTTTCEALWMGRPVVTLAGDRHAGRVGASLLTAVGRAAWVARTEAEYVGIARELANDAGKRETEAKELRGTLQQSPLLDHAGQAGRLGVALRALWRAYVAKWGRAA